jgi:hypothetical protein
LSQTVYEIKTPSITLKITVAEVNSLHIHEEVIPELLSQLAERIRSNGVLRDPVIVDEKTLILLDGVHRVAAIRHLGLKYIPVCLVDYDDPNIKIYSWSRVVKSKKPTFRDLEEARKTLIDSVIKLGFRLTTIPNLEKGLEALGRRELASIMVLGRTPIGVKSRTREIKQLYEDIKRIERALILRGFDIDYDTEKDALESVHADEVVAVIIPPTITKKEVRDAALKGEVFIHKATRHIIPARPLGVNVPLDWLSGTRSLSDVQRMLVEYLSGKKLKTLPPGSIIDRRYEEEIYIFE